MAAHHSPSTHTIVFSLLLSLTSLSLYVGPSSLYFCLPSCVSASAWLSLGLCHPISVSKSHPPLASVTQTYGVFPRES